MSSLVDTYTTDKTLLPENANSPFNRALFDAKDVRELSGSYIRIRLHVPDHLQGTGVKIITFYTDIGSIDFVFYTDRISSYIKIIVSTYAVSQDIGNALLEKPFEKRQAFAREIVMRMNTKTETLQALDRLCQIFTLNLRKSKPMLEQSRMLSPKVSLQNRKGIVRIVNIQVGKGEKPESIVENRRWTDNLVGLIVDKIPEIPEMAIRVEDKRIEQENPGKLRIRQNLFPARGL